SHEVGGVQTERFLNRAFLCLLIAQISARQGEMNPTLCVGAVDVAQALEGRPGALHVTPSEGHLSKGGQRSAVIRVDREKTAPQLDRFPLPSPLGCTHGRSFERIDFLQYSLLVLHNPFPVVPAAVLAAAAPLARCAS